MSKLNLIEPDWPLAGRVGAVVTTRAGGLSQSSCASLNLGSNTLDDPLVIQQNRRILMEQLDLDAPIQWLRQVHGTRVVTANAYQDQAPEADAWYTRQPGLVCAVLTADCLPVFLGDVDATEVAVVHAGWRGMAAGIIARALENFRAPAGSIHAWLGPAISSAHYEVGDELIAAFRRAPSFAGLPLDQAFQPRADGKWSADLYQLAYLQLGSLGVNSITGGDRCTYAEPQHFYSHRRDGETGRFASLIWLKN